MNSVEITMIVGDTKVIARIDCETPDEVAAVLARVNGFEGFMSVTSKPVPTPAPTPRGTSWATLCEPAPAPGVPPLSRVRHAWMPGHRTEAQALLELGMPYEDVAAEVGRTPDGIAMAVHAGYLTLPLDHPRRTRRSKAPPLPTLAAAWRKPIPAQGALRLATPADVRPTIDTLRAAGAL